MTPSPTHDSEDMEHEFLILFRRMSVCAATHQGSNAEWIDGQCVTPSLAAKEAMKLVESHYLKPEEVEAAFKRGQRVGQYQAADRLYLHVTTMWMFKDDADPKLQMPERANDMLKDCEKYMNHNRKVYSEYVAQLSKLNREEKKDAKT